MTLRYLSSDLRKSSNSRTRPLATATRPRSSGAVNSAPLSHAPLVVAIACWRPARPCNYHLLDFADACSIAPNGELCGCRAWVVHQERLIWHVGSYESEVMHHTDPRGAVVFAGDLIALTVPAVLIAPNFLRWWVPTSWRPSSSSLPSRAATGPA